uniref:Uncharacterized protein n=1 Tax=Romanomermis culicivorax TaxID=13658 RepID=A0A915KLE6_ROMCU
MYDRLAQLILKLSVEFYRKIAENEGVLEKKVAFNFLQALHKPLSTEYSPELSNNYYYKQSVQSLTDLIEFIIPDTNAMLIKNQDRIEFFIKLADCIEAFMSLSCKETLIILFYQTSNIYRRNLWIESLISFVRSAPKDAKNKRQTLQSNSDGARDKDAQLSVIGAAEVCLSTCHE